MQRNSPIIQLELNELTPKLMFRFMAEGKLPNFKRLYDESQVFTTDAAEQGENLNPWVQWVTVHSGQSFAEHGVFHLGDGGRLGSPGIGRVVSQADRRVLICGSMNVRYPGPIAGVSIPDPWTTDVEPHPAELAPYFRFVQQHVLEHTNERVPLGWREYLAFLVFMASHGLSVDTAFAIARQLVGELAGRGSWRRVTLLDRLQWDVFRWYYKRLRPDLSTFFLNSVAHLQHTHWRNLEPELFKIKPSAEDQAEYHDAVLFGYQENDRVIGRFLDLAGDQATLVFCTALSQQPCLVYEEAGAKHFYRPYKFEDLFAFAGVPVPYHYSPVMSEEFHLDFEDEASARDAEKRLLGLRVGEESVLKLGRTGMEIYGGCQIFHPLPAAAVLHDTNSGKQTPFFDVFYQADSIKSGIHHPDGLLWIRQPDRQHAIHDEKVPLTSVAPTVLSLLGVDAPASMRGEPLL
jgi:hypothetical protein